MASLLSLSPPSALSFSSLLFGRPSFFDFFFRAICFVLCVPFCVLFSPSSSFSLPFPFFFVRTLVFRSFSCNILAMSTVHGTAKYMIERPLIDCAILAKTVDGASEARWRTTTHSKEVENNRCVQVQSNRSEPPNNTQKERAVVPPAQRDLLHLLVHAPGPRRAAELLPRARVGQRRVV